MSKEQIYLSVIIPSYNEEKRLPKTLEQIEKYLSIQTYSYEIIVVDGGSTDQTAEVVKNLFPKFKNLKLIKVENLGKGYAVKAGMLKAQGKYRIFTDADNSTPINQVEKMWPFFESGFDVIIGSRDIKGADIAVSQPWHRVILGNIFNLIVQVLTGLWKIWDTQCGFKGFSAQAAEKIFSLTEIKGFGFDPEVLVLAKNMGYKIKEIPVTWINDPESKVKFKSMVKMLFEVLKIRWNMLRGKYQKETPGKEITFTKIDLIYCLILGKIISWLVFIIFKTLEFDVVFYEITKSFGLKIDLSLFLVLLIPFCTVICVYITYLLGKKYNSTIYQFGKFLTVGISNTLIDWGILNFQILLTGITSGLFYSVFKTLSFAIAVFNSFFWNKIWTFKNKGAKRTRKELFQFLMISLVGLVINVGVASVVVNIIGPQGEISPKIWATVGALIATMFSMGWNFIGYKFIVFK